MLTRCAAVAAEERLSEWPWRRLIFLISKHAIDTSMKDRILVLADDLTGALEAGAKFAGQGIRTLVSTELSLRPKGCDESIGVLVIDAETRHLPAAEAGQRVWELAHAAGEQGFRYLYKKTDSTLRGNIASELGALAEAFPGSALLYAPAYPRMGRTVKRGMLYVHGVRARWCRKHWGRGSRRWWSL
jgi:uncharacterized protein YgbK (DUF1537 family)